MEKNKPNPASAKTPADAPAAVTGVPMRLRIEPETTPATKMRAPIHFDAINSANAKAMKRRNELKKR